MSFATSTKLNLSTEEMNTQLSEINTADHNYLFIHVDRTNIMLKVILTTISHSFIRIFVIY